MRKSKKVIALTLAAMMIVATLIGCGNDTTKENTTNNEVVTETPSPETNVPETDAPTTETPTPETNVPETETIDWEYSGSWEFPTGMNGFTDKYVNESKPDWSVNHTHYEDNFGNTMNFTWEGPKDLGEKATTSDRTLSLFGTNCELRAWTYGAVDETKFAEDLTYTKETWTSFAASHTPYITNGYYDIKTTDTTIEVTFEVANDTQKGYNYYVVDLTKGTCYQFAYLENIETYDNDRVLNVIDSLDFWNDYTPEN